MHVDKFVGRVAYAPEVKYIGQKDTPLLELVLAENERRKNKDSGEYEDTGNTTWLTVKLWGDAAEDADFVKGDLVEFSGSVVEEQFERKDGTSGRKLVSTWVDEDGLTIKFPSKDREDDGFTPDSSDSGDGW